MCLSARQMFRSSELQSSLGSRFYKHLVPPGPKTKQRKTNRLISCANFRHNPPVSPLRNLLRKILIPPEKFSLIRSLSEDHCAAGGFLF